MGHGHSVVLKASKAQSSPLAFTHLADLLPKTGCLIAAAVGSCHRRMLGAGTGHSSAWGSATSWPLQAVAYWCTVPYPLQLAKPNLFMEVNDGRGVGTPCAASGSDQSIKLLPSTQSCLPTSNYFSSLILVPRTYIHDQLPSRASYFSLVCAVDRSSFQRLEDARLSDCWRRLLFSACPTTA